MISIILARFPHLDGRDKGTEITADIRLTAIQNAPFNAENRLTKP
jgi:hypothetical protein